MSRWNPYTGDNRCAHEWRAAPEGGWKASLGPKPNARPWVAVQVVYCAKCDACVDMPVDLVRAAGLPEDPVEHGPTPEEVELKAVEAEAAADLAAELRAVLPGAVEVRPLGPADECDECGERHFPRADGLCPCRECGRGVGPLGLLEGLCFECDDLDAFVELRLPGDSP